MSHRDSLSSPVPRKGHRARVFRKLAALTRGHAHNATAAVAAEPDLVPAPYTLGDDDSSTTSSEALPPRVQDEPSLSDTDGDLHGNGGGAVPNVGFLPQAAVDREVLDDQLRRIRVTQREFDDFIIRDEVKVRVGGAEREGGVCEAAMVRVQHAAAVAKAGDVDGLMDVRAGRERHGRESESLGCLFPSQRQLPTSLRRAVQVPPVDACGQTRCIARGGSLVHGRCA